MAARIIDPSPSPCTYHVFLSFRGADTRTSFTDFLYEALEQAGFHTFRDDNDIRRGKSIEAEIRRGIMESKMSIIVLSKGYASSEWCLDELVMIIGRARIGGYVVLPVFYDVDPDQVWDQTHYYAEAFAGHQEKFEDDRVEGWRKALRDVANLAGMVLGERHQAPFIQDVVKFVRKELDCKILHVPKLFGAESNIQWMNSWLNVGPDNVRVFIIYGIGGVGKTTIAKTFYNQNFDKFEGASFLAKVKDISEQPNGLICLQRQLVSDILKKETKEMCNVDQGILQIKNAICCRRVLIVIDDVDEVEQFNAIVGMLDWVYPGSKVIVTTRQQNFLEQQGGCWKLEVKPLDDDKALKVFSWHCFQQEYPIDGYVEKSKNVVKHCGGLPLALKILGSSLACNHDLWKIELQEPTVMDYDGKIQKVLRISFESLQDDRDKRLFLDIACFFVGKKRHIVDKIAECYGFYRSVGLQKLVDQCLITIDKDNILMHKLVRDMGREIVRQQSPEDLGKRSRLWQHKDVITVLEDNIGTAEIRGIALSMNSAVQTNQENSKVVKVKTEALSQMLNLKFLQLDYVKPSTHCRNFPERILWLCWHGFPIKSIPRCFSLEKLVVLEMCYSNLTNVWEGRKSLPKLKILDLSHSRNLLRTPDFSEVPSLEKLVLEGCISLAKVHKSIYNLKSLKEFTFDGSSRLDGLFMEPQRKGSWWSLALHKACIRGSPSPSSFSLSLVPSSVVELSLTNCNITDACIPENLSFLPSLRSLDLSGNPIQSLPESIINLTTLAVLNLVDCKMLQSLPELPGQLAVYVHGCSSLERLSNIPKAVSIGICDKLIEVEDWIKRELIDQLDKEMMEIMEVVDNMANASQKPSIMINLVEGILGVWLGGCEVPRWFDHQVVSYSLTMTVPPLPLGHKLCGLNLCFVFSWKVPSPQTFFALATISNQTKCMEWSHGTLYMQLWQSECMEKVLWLAHFKIGKYLESGDQVKVSALVQEGIEVERCGVHFHYTKEEEEGEQDQSHALTYPNLLKDYHCILRGAQPQLTAFYYHFIRRY